MSLPSHNDHTHRPVVDKGWFEDFHKIFKLFDGYTYGSREMGEPFEVLEKVAKKNPSQHYVYFASMQDLRGAQLAGGKFDKNSTIFKAEYDMLIIDEAHEGTQTELGQNVIKLLTKANTHVLNLSGTPFNLLEDYSEDEIYTWDYVMEQRAKAEWDINHFGGQIRMQACLVSTSSPLTSGKPLPDLRTSKTQHSTSRNSSAPGQEI